jgi:hypothetical protein
VGDDLGDHEAVEDVRWDGGAPASVTGVEIARSRRIRIDDEPPDLTEGG